MEGGKTEKWSGKAKFILLEYDYWASSTLSHLSQQIKN